MAPPKGRATFGETADLAEDQGPGSGEGSMQIYYGWRVVLLSIVIYVLVFGSTVSSFSLYVVPVSSELGLTRAEMNTAFVLINVGSAMWAPFIGRALDRYSLRLILAVSGLLMSLGFVALALSHAIWLSVLALAIGVAIGLDGAAMLTMTVLVARWFKIQRARAMTISVMGQALGKVIMPVPTALLIEAYGWRTTLVVIAIVIFAVLLLAAIFVRDRPSADELEPGASTFVAPPAVDGKSDETLASVPHLLGLQQFWLIAVGIALTFTISGTLAISMVPLGLDYGLTMTQGALMASSYAGAALAAKFVLAVFADKMDRFSLVVGLLLVGVPLFAAFFLVQGAMQLFAYIVILGFSVGGFAALYPVLQADVFGIVSYGTVRGLMIPIQSICVALGAFGAGWIHDMTGTYDALFVAFAVAQAVVAIMIHCARPSVTDPIRSANQAA